VESREINKLAGEPLSFTLRSKSKYSCHFLTLIENKLKKYIILKPSKETQNCLIFFDAHCLCNMYYKGEKNTE